MGRGIRVQCSRVRGEYIDKFSYPDTVHAICEEFRASPALDYQQDEADRGNRKISCPVLFLRSQHGASRNFTMTRS